MTYEYQEDVDTPNAKRNITIAYAMASSKMKVDEEYLVQDFVGMLGSIGGTLGLFVGFSFTGSLSFVLDQLQIFLERISSSKKIEDVTQENDEQTIIKVVPMTYSNNHDSISKIEAKIQELISMNLKYEKRCHEMAQEMTKISKVLGIVQKRKK